MSTSSLPSYDAATSTASFERVHERLDRLQRTMLARDADWEKRLAAETSLRGDLTEQYRWLSGRFEARLRLSEQAKQTGCRCSGGSGGGGGVSGGDVVEDGLKVDLAHLKSDIAVIRVRAKQLETNERVGCADLDRLERKVSLLHADVQQLRDNFSASRRDMTEMKSMMETRYNSLAHNLMPQFVPFLSSVPTVLLSIPVAFLGL